MAYIDTDREDFDKFVHHPAIYYSPLLYTLSHKTLIHLLSSISLFLSPKFKLQKHTKMVFDRSNSSNSSTSTSPSSSSSRSWPSTKVLAIECIRGTSRADEWSGGLLQTGDIVEEILIGDLSLRSPFKDGNSGVQKQLHSCFKSKITEIRVRVRRGEFDSAELTGCIVPEGRKKQRYVLRAIDDPNYAVTFFDRSESDCLKLQGNVLCYLFFALTHYCICFKIKSCRGESSKIVYSYVLEL